MTGIGTKRYCHLLCTGLLVVFTATAGTAAEDKNRDRDRDKGPEASPPAPVAGSKVDELSSQSKEVLGWANEFAKEVTHVIEGWINSGALTEDRLFSYLYYPVPNTDPTKYTTDYDGLADRDFAAINEKYAAKSNLLIYAIPMDRNGYVPTHNRQYSQPLTGNRAVDLLNNRTKRIFGDQIGFRAARSQKPHLLQSYSRDTGEAVADISVPIMIRGRHWGCVRIGFRQVDRQQ